MAASSSGQVALAVDMAPRHLDSGKTGCGHFRNDRVGRPEIGEIAGLRLWKIGAIQPVVGPLRTHIVERESAPRRSARKASRSMPAFSRKMVGGVRQLTKSSCPRQTATPHCRRAPRRCAAFCVALVATSRASRRDRRIWRSAPVGDPLVAGAARTTARFQPPLKIRFYPPKRDLPLQSWTHHHSESGEHPSS
jgi:hypothetical protein